MNASVVLVIGYSFLTLSVFFLVRPAAFDRFVDLAMANLWPLAGLRLVLGTLLFLGAPYTRLPETIRIVGILVFIGGLVTPVLGPHAAGQRWIAFARRHLRVVTLLSMAFGALLVYSAA